MIKTVLKLLILVLPVCVCAKHVEKEKKIDFPIGSCALPALATTFEVVGEIDPGSWKIVLSDGSQWIVTTPIAGEEIATNWSVGDDIRIEVGLKEEGHSGKFILKNVRNGAAYLADLDRNCLDSPHACFVERIDRDGYAMISTGGVQWAVGYLGSFSTQKWHPGDRIIINKSYFSGLTDYTLINVTDRSSCWGSIVMWR